MSNPKDYAVGWICAISTEYVAAQAFLDEKHDGPEYVSPNDNNDYTLGRIGKHNVVIAVLPDGEYGTSSASGVAKDMLHSFPNIRIGLMVGIGGGVPGPNHDIRLGDIVVSAPRDGKGGVLQYDFGKTIQDRSFQLTGFLNQPPTVLRTAVSGLKAQYESDGHHIDEAIMKVLDNKPRLQKKYRRPESANDTLYQAWFVHPSSDGANCTEVCGNNPVNLMARKERSEIDDNPAIHYGLIASGNQLMKDAVMRDKLAEDQGVLCFEMEAAGLINQFPCLVVRGICDYSDSHKNKDWQGYAAMTAAAYTKDLLRRISPNRIEAEKKIGDILTDIQDTVHDLRCGQHREEFETILNWLTPIDYAPQQNDNVKRRQQGTGQWLLNSKKYQTWHNTSSQTLFCPGIPGAGKTILTSIVIDDLCKRHPPDSGQGIAYIYCNYRRQTEQQVETLLASLLKQLSRSQPDLPLHIKDLYVQHRAKQTRPSLNELSAALNCVTTMFSRTFIIVDALDECQTSDGCRAKFLSEIFRLQAKTDVNIFATSRPDPYIEKEFKSRESTSLEILATCEDVRTYLDGRMAELPAFVSKRPDLQEEIKTQIAWAVEGMFLLAQLYFDELQDKTSPKDMRHALEEFRKENTKGSLESSEEKKLGALTQAYSHAMDRINGQRPGFRSLALKVIYWITCAKKRLTVSELQHALAVEYDDSDIDTENLRDAEDMVSVCAGLVIFDKESSFLRLVHYTTQEYFEQAQKIWFPDAHKDIALTCITYLSFSPLKTEFCASGDEFTSMLEQHPLYSYAARFWGDHARLSSMPNSPEILNFLRNETSLSWPSRIAILPSLYGIYNESMKLTGIHLAAYFGLVEALSTLAGTGYYLDSKDDESRRVPLLVAARNGHEAVVKLLVEMGADLKVRGHDTGHNIAIVVAAERGHEGVVKMLLEARANLPIGSGQRVGRMALMAAVENGHETIVKLLIEKGINLGRNLELDWNLLQLALKNQHETVARLLFDNGLNLESGIEFGDRLVWSALETSCDAVMLLFGLGDDAERHKRVLRLTPLAWAAGHGLKDMVKLLIEYGAKLESKDYHGRTPLSLAVENRKEATMEILIAAGANFESKDDLGQTPIFSAMLAGHKRMVQMLIEKGASLTVKDLSGHTPISLAHAKRLTKMADLLESHCASSAELGQIVNE